MVHLNDLFMRVQIINTVYISNIALLRQEMGQVCWEEDVDEWICYATNGEVEKAGWVVYKLLSGHVVYSHIFKQSASYKALCV